jgi:hypothetical protein
MRAQPMPMESGALLPSGTSITSAASADEALWVIKPSGVLTTYRWVGSAYAVAPRDQPHSRSVNKKAYDMIIRMTV